MGWARLLPLLLIVPIGPGCRDDRDGQRAEDRRSRAARLARDIGGLERRVEGIAIVQGVLLWDSLTRGEPGRTQALLPITSELVTPEQIYEVRRLENSPALPGPDDRRRLRYLRGNLTWIYLMRFGLGLAVLFAVSRWQWFIESIREPYCEVLAFTLHHAFAWFGIETRLKGAMVIPLEGAGGIQVVTECDGLVLLALFGAGVFAVPLARTAGPWLLALAGFAFLIVLNWFRLAALAFTSFFYPVIFDSMHHYFMQGILMLAVLALYVSWLRHLEPPAPPEPGAGEASPAA